MAFVKPTVRVRAVPEVDALATKVAFGGRSLLLSVQVKRSHLQMLSSTKNTTESKILERGVEGETGRKSKVTG